MTAELHPNYPGISVIKPMFNSADFLRDAISSVLSQDYLGPVELLIGDDGSTDGSYELAISYGSKVRVFTHNKRENKGVSATRNRLIRESSFPLIAFLDSDDLFLQGHLRMLASEAVADSSAGLFYDNGCYSIPLTSSSTLRFAPDHSSITAAELLVDCCLLVNSVMLKKSVLDKVGLFNEQLRFGEDHDFWLRCLEKCKSK